MDGRLNPIFGSRMRFVATGTDKLSEAKRFRQHGGRTSQATKLTTLTSQLNSNVVSKANSPTIGIQTCLSSLPMTIPSPHELLQVTYFKRSLQTSPNFLEEAQTSPALITRLLMPQISHVNAQRDETFDGGAVNTPWHQFRTASHSMGLYDPT